MSNTIPPHSRKAYFPFANKRAASLYPASPQSLHCTEFKSTNEKKLLATTRENPGRGSFSLVIHLFFMKKSPYKGTTSWKSPSFFKVRWQNAAKRRGVRDQFFLLTLCANQTEICSDNMWLIILAGASHFNKFLPFYHKSHCICLADKTLF